MWEYDDFEWNPHKANGNYSKHGISFIEASTVFDDPFVISRLDPRYGQGEERWYAVGQSHTGKLLVVWYTERGDRIRIIGTRKATSVERRNYEDERTF